MTDLVPPDSAPGRLTIDLAALAENWAARQTRRARTMRRRGQGRTPTESASTGRRRRCGPRRPEFFVAHLGEGFAARRLLPDDAEIYVLNGLEAGADPADYAAPPEAGDRQRSGARALVGRPRRRAALRAPARLHLDTGMSRLGFNSLAALRLAMQRNGAASGADLLMSHFVSSEFPDDSINSEQISRFEAARQAFPRLRLRSPIRPESSSRRARSTIWRGPAMRSTAAIPRRAGRTRCVRS